MALLPVALVLYTIKVLGKIQFYRVNSSRIGHLAVNQDLFLRRLKLGLLKNVRTKYVGIAATDICNKSLLQILKKKMTIIQIPQSKIFRAFTKYVATQSILSKWGLFVILPNNNNEYYEYTNTIPVLSFSKEEEKAGKELLQKMGVNNWFVCFHARTPIHINTFLRKGDYRHQFRNSGIDNFLEAAKYIADAGGFALRMGATVEQALPRQEQFEIIDYATHFRTELGDIYLTARCKFFLGDSTGLQCVGYTFNVPIAMANVIPLKYQPYTGKQDIFIPKKIWSIKEQRFLTFPEIITSPIFHYYHQKEYDAAGLEPVSNTPEEILELAVEMNQRLDGTWSSTSEEEELQRKFKSLFPVGNFCYGFPSRIGASFLRKNNFLLER